MALEQEEEIIAFVQGIQTGLAGATFEDKRRILELIELRVDIIDQQRMKLSAIVSPGAIVDTTSS